MVYQNHIGKLYDTIFNSVKFDPRINKGTREGIEQTDIIGRVGYPGRVAAAVVYGQCALPPHRRKTARVKRIRLRGIDGYYPRWYNFKDGKKCRRC